MYTIPWCPVGECSEIIHVYRITHADRIPASVFFCLFRSEKPVSPYHPPGQVRLALPKGRMFDQVVDLLKGAGISIQQTDRGYRPTISLPDYDAKILNPRNVIGMLNADARDVGFAGADWIAETNSQLPELLNTGLNPVRLVVAAPTEILVDGKLPGEEFVDRQGVSAAGLLEREKSATHSGDDLGLAADDPAFGAGGRQIRDRQRTAVRPDDVFYPRAMGFCHGVLTNSQPLNSRRNPTRRGLKIR